MDEQDRLWKAKFDALPRGAAGACPRIEVMSTWAKGPIPEDAVAHLAACFSCREELVEIRRRLTEKGQTESPRRDLYRLMPVRKVPVGWIAAAAAAILIAVGLVIAYSGTETAPPPRPIVVQPPKAPPPVPPRETPPPTPQPVPPKPEEKPLAPPPAPEKPPAPAPVKETPAVAKPNPEPEKPPPSPTVPEKPAPSLTRAKLKGSLVGMFGSASTQIGTDAWQPLKPGQGRDFNGAVKIKADVSATKLRLGAHTFFIQRGAELALTLEEGHTGVKLSRGEAFFDIVPGPEPFDVEMPLGPVAVKGTRFFVSETDVAVQRGLVHLNAIAIAAGERSTGGPAQKVDLTKRLAWVRALEDTIRIEADQMALQGGMTILQDAAAGNGRVIGAKTPLKAGTEATAEIGAKRKQPATYAVWIRVHWAHGVPSGLMMTVGDALTWSAKAVPANPNWQWVRAGTADLPDQPFRVRLADPQGGIRIDQILLTSDSDFNPEGK